MTTWPMTTAPFNALGSRTIEYEGTDARGHELQKPLLADDLMLLTVPDAARRLGISRSLLYELLANGVVESIRIGRLRRVPAAALAAFVDERRAEVRSSPIGSGLRGTQDR